MEFFEAPAFTRYVSSYLTDDEYREMQGRLANAPEAGDMIPGTGGFRKLRWADPKRGKGKRRLAGDLLLFLGGATDLAHHALRQE
jgi:hypothetical protein